MTHSSRTRGNMARLKNHSSLQEWAISSLKNKMNYLPVGHFLETAFNQDILDGGGAKNWL